MYASAAKVVVIDKTLTHSRIDEAAEHVLWSIVSSSWNQRLWTFQEAFLPESIDLLFEDDSLPFEPSRLPRSKLPPVAQVVWRNLFDRVASIRPNQSQHVRRKTNLGEVLAAMNWRTTSRKTDETLAAAALLDFDPWSLPGDEEDAEGRMEALLLLVRDLPNDIIFFTCDTEAISVVQADTEAICTADGLLTRQCFVSFEKVSLDQEDGQFWFRDHSTMAIYGILWDLEPDRQSGEINAVIVRPIEDDQYLRPEVIQMVEGVAVLLGDNNGGGIPTAAYVGIVGIAQREEKDLFEGTIFRDATWRTEMLCIT